jgi:hypothetical protein
MFEAPWSYPEKINIDQQINELKRERAFRERVYNRMIHSNSLKKSAAEYQMGALDACIATLEYMKAHRTVIVTAVAAQRQFESNILGPQA